MPVTLRVGAGCRVIRWGIRGAIRGAFKAAVPVGHLTLMPAHVPITVASHPAPDGPYRTAALLIAPGLAAHAATSTDDQRALAVFCPHIGPVSPPRPRPKPFTTLR